MEHTVGPLHFSQGRQCPSWAFRLLCLSWVNLAPQWRQSRNCSWLLETGWGREEKEFGFEREEEKAINWKITVLQAMESITQRLKCHKEYTSAPELGKCFFHHNYSLPPTQDYFPSRRGGACPIHCLSTLPQNSRVPLFIHSINSGQHQWALTMYQLLTAY